MNSTENYYYSFYEIYWIELFIFEEFDSRGFGSLLLNGNNLKQNQNMFFFFKLAFCCCCCWNERWSEQISFEFQFVTVSLPHPTSCLEKMQNFETFFVFLFCLPKFEINIVVVLLRQKTPLNVLLLKFVNATMFHVFKWNLTSN